MAGTFRQRDTRTHTEDVLGALTEASVSAGCVCLGRLGAVAFRARSKGVAFQSVLK